MRTKPDLLSARFSYAAAFSLCIGALAIALYLQHVQGLEPCPLCMVQRVLMITTATVCLLAAMHAPRTRALGRRVYGASVALVALLGVAVALRHLWLQHLGPELAPACGPGLQYIFAHFPWQRALTLVMLGSGECSEVLWTFLGLSLPAWTLMAFIGLFAFGLKQVWLPQERRQ